MTRDEWGVAIVPRAHWQAVCPPLVRLVSPSRYLISATEAATRKSSARLS